MNFSIGLSGLKSAQQALELVGTNLANASTEGYHRQEIRFAPVQLGSTSAGASGVRVVCANRTYDFMVERELLRQQPLLGQLDQELKGLYSIESVLGQVENNPLGESLRDFFASLNDLSADPTSSVNAQQVVWTADTLAVNFRSMAEYLDDVKFQLSQEAESLIAEVNNKAESVARLNLEIDLALSRDSSANVLMDQRDQAINELAELADVTVMNHSDTSGEVTVSAWGIPIVVDSTFKELQTGLEHGDQLGVSAKSATDYDIVSGGGKIGGILNLYNDIVKNLEDKLDTLAKQVMYSFNAIQSQGIGTEGSFSSLDGTTVFSADPMSAWQPPVEDGELFLRLIGPSGDVESHSITINSGDTLEDVVNAINLISPGNITANIVDKSLHVETANDYKFDFVPDNTITTDGSDGTSGLAGEGGGIGVPSVTTNGIYEGSNQTYNFKFVVPGAGVGEIGVNENINVEVRNQAGELVKTIAIGNGYAAGDQLEIEQGLYVSFGQGVVHNGEDFSISARSDSDTAGFLVSAGLNTFFKGFDASSMEVRSEFLDNPMLFGTAAGPDGEDNFNAQRMAELSETRIADLGGKEIMEFLNAIGTEIGQQVMTRESRNTALDATMQELENRRDEVSGVDSNAEAAKLLVYERMFQSMSKFISVQDESLENLLNLL